MARNIPGRSYEWSENETLADVWARLRTDDPIVDPLASLGYKSYENYLSRVLWKRIRKRVLERDRFTCKRCNGRAAIVHHRSYTLEVLKGENDEQLVSLCEGCHHVIEYDDDGQRRIDREKEAVLYKPCSRVDYPPIKVDLRLKYTSLPNAWNRMNWWQRTGWSAEHEYVRVDRKWPDNPNLTALMDRYKLVYESIRARTAETDWRAIASPVSQSEPSVDEAPQQVDFGK